MTRAFVVIGEIVAVVTDLDRRFIELNESQRRDVDPAYAKALAGRLRDVDLLLAENRVERVLRENVFDIGNEKFLMLLLVMNPESQDRLDLAK